MIKVRINDRTPSGIFPEDISFLHSPYSLGKEEEIVIHRNASFFGFIFFACWEIVRIKKAFFDFIEIILLCIIKNKSIIFSIKKIFS